MSEPTTMRGGPLAADLYETVRADLATLRDRGVVPLLGTVLMSDDPAAASFMDLKGERCAEAGVRTERVDLPADAPAERLYAAVERLADDDAVTAVFVQTPLPDGVDEMAVRSRVPVEKDVDCLAPANLGRLVADDPVVVPATTAAVTRLLDGYGVATAGRDAVVVGRTTTVGLPVANRLLARGPGGDATVTVCHTATEDLAARTRAADLLVTAAGVPGLVDGSMVSSGVVVVDVSANRIPSDEGHDVVGDVDAASVRPTADAFTPVPGGVGPLTLAVCSGTSSTSRREPRASRRRSRGPVPRDAADRRSLRSTPRRLRPARDSPREHRPAKPDVDVGPGLRLHRSRR